MNLDEENLAAELRNALRLTPAEIEELQADLRQALAWGKRELTRQRQAKQSPEH